jgi:tetratricopeptide (TPR) repeat protein
MIDPLSTWNSAKADFDEGRLQDALNQFLPLRAENPRDAALFFNVGNLQLRLGHYGQAVASFYRAHSLAPDPLEIHQTHEFARQSVLSQTAVEWDPSATWYERLDGNLPLSGFAAAAALFCALLAIFRRRLGHGASRNAPLAACALISVIAASLAWMTSRSAQAVAAESSVVRSGPGDSFLELGRLDAGIQVRDLVSDPATEWARVRFSSRGTGWVRKSTLLPLE